MKRRASAPIGERLAAAAATAGTCVAILFAGSIYVALLATVWAFIRWVLS